MSVIGTSVATHRMTLHSARSNEPEMAREKFSQNIQTSNTADSGSRQPHLDKVNRALAHEETSGLFEIYETPELRSLTSMSILRTGSPLTSLPVSTAAGTAAGTPRRGTLLEEMCNVLLRPAPFSDEPYPPCYTRWWMVPMILWECLWRTGKACPLMTKDTTMVPSLGEVRQPCMTESGKPFGSTPVRRTHRKWMCSQAAQHQDLPLKVKSRTMRRMPPPFILNTPTCRMSERQVMIAPYPLEDDWLERDLLLVFNKGLVTLGGSWVRVSAGTGGGCNLEPHIPAKYLQTPMWLRCCGACIAPYTNNHTQPLNSTMDLYCTCTFDYLPHH